MFNEEENVVPMSEALIAQMGQLPAYDYEIVFIDNDSQDQTRRRLEELCAGNKRIKAIFNARNFGQFNSPFYGIAADDGRLRHIALRRLSGPARDDPAACRGMGEGL